MSDNISIRHALKKYGDNVIIPDLNLEIKEGEFFTPVSYTHLTLPTTPYV